MELLPKVQDDVHWDLLERSGASSLGPDRSMCPSMHRYQASRDDLAVYSALHKAPSAKEYPHAARWYSHIEALLGQRCDAELARVAKILHFNPQRLPFNTIITHQKRSCKVSSYFMIAGLQFSPLPIQGRFDQSSPHQLSSK